MIVLVHVLDLQANEMINYLHLSLSLSESPYIMRGRDSLWSMIMKMDRKIWCVCLHAGQFLDSL